MSMDEKLVALFERQNNLLDQVAELLNKQQELATKRHADMLRKLDSIEGYLSLIQGNNET